MSHAHARRVSTEAVMNACRRACAAWADLRAGESDRTVQLATWMDHLAAVMQAHDDARVPMVVDVEVDEVRHA